MWDLKQRNFFCVRLRPHSLWTQAGKRSTLGCGCRDSQCIESAAALLSLPMSLSSGSRHRGGEWVTYLDLLNSFHQWQKSNYLPGNARLLYYGLLAVFNEARWPEQVQIDNFRLMSMLDTRMLMCHKVTHKNLIDSSPLFRYYLTHTPCNFFVKPIDSDTSEEI